jgi:hypothetical protein
LLLAGRWLLERYLRGARGERQLGRGVKVG